MSVTYSMHKYIRSFLRRFNLKMEKTNTDGLTFTDEQLIKALQEITTLYNEFVFPGRKYNDPQISMMKNLIGTGFGESLYILDSLQNTLTLEGDICEFGVAQGATSALIAQEIMNSRKTLWLFDSFKGLPKPTKKDKLINDIFNLGTMDAYKGKMACPVEMVESRLAEIGFPPERMQIVPGFIETTIKSQNLPEKVCFAYIDFDFYEPILIALTYLDRVLPSGGIVIVDDYNFFSEGVKVAVDEFLNGVPGKYILELPITSAGHFCILKKK